MNTEMLHQYESIKNYAYLTGSVNKFV